MNQEPETKRGAARPSSFYHQAAKASWAAPLVAVVINLVASVSFTLSRSGRIGVAVACGILVVGGLVLGIASLFGIARHGRKGILVPGVVGIALNVAFLALAVATLSWYAGMARRRAQFLRGKAARTRKQSSDALHKHPGWIGVATHDGVFIGVASWDHRSLAARDLDAKFAAPVSFLIISVDNQAGTTPLTLDPSSLRLTLADGSVHAALKTTDVLATAREDRDTLRRLHAGPHTAGPGAACEGIAFIPYAFDMSKVVSVTLALNGKDYVIEGHYLTAEQKQARRAAPD